MFIEFNEMVKREWPIYGLAIGASIMIIIIANAIVEAATESWDNYQENKMERDPDEEIEFDNGSVTVKLHYHRTSEGYWSFRTWNNNTNSSYRIVVTGEQDFKCYSNNTQNTEKGFITQIRFIQQKRNGNELKLSVRVINFKTGYDETKILRHNRFQERKVHE